MAVPGWRFSVTIPSWTQTALEGDELVVFYRVEVKVLPPDEAAAPRSRSVLRRFSHFQKLYRILREELGAKVMLARAVPAKWSLLGVNKKPELIEKRRRELEVWLWKLIADPDIARSRMLNNFLELTDAARMVTKPPRLSPAASAASRNGAGSVASRGDGVSFAASDGTRSDAEESSSEASYAATGSTITALEQPTQDLRLGSQLLRSPTDSSVAAAAQRSSQPDFSDGPDAMRLGLHMEQRAGLRQLTKTLQQRLLQASSDLQDAIEALRTEQRVKRELAARVTELEAATAEARAAEEPASPPTSPPAATDAAAAVAAVSPSILRPPSPDEELTRLLAEERQRTAELQKALQLESGQNTELRDDLTALSTELHRLQTEQAATQQAQASSPSPPESSPSLAEGPAAFPVAEHSASDGQVSSAALQEVEALTRQLDEANAAAASASTTAAEAAAKSRADMKVLAKEVRSLRQQLAAAEAERTAAEARQADAEARAVAQTQRADAAEAERAAAVAAQAQASLSTEPAQPAAANAAVGDSADAAAASAAQPVAMPQALGDAERRLLREVAALRSRLAEASAEHMSRPDFPLEAPDDLGPGSAMHAVSPEALDASDRRLEALQAEAQLLQDSLADAHNASPAEAELRRAFAEVLAEVASLRLRNNGLLRTAAAATRDVRAQLTRKQSGDAAHNGQPRSPDLLKRLSSNGPSPAQLMQAKFQDFANRFGKQQQPSGNGSL